MEQIIPNVSSWTTVTFSFVLGRILDNTWKNARSQKRSNARVTIWKIWETKQVEIDVWRAFKQRAVWEGMVLLWRINPQSSLEATNRQFYKAIKGQFQVEISLQRSNCFYQLIDHNLSSSTFLQCTGRCNKRFKNEFNATFFWFGGEVTRYHDHKQER